jgi:1,4-alpha-glucan branching enzyme
MMATAVLTKGTLRAVSFRLDGRLVPEAHSVALVASFNRWDTSVHRLRHEPDGSWALSVMLPPGEYPYLFVVDGVPWNDPQDDGRAPCEWGGSYSLRVVH